MVDFENFYSKHEKPFRLCEWCKEKVLVNKRATYCRSCSMKKEVRALKAAKPQKG